MTTTEAALPGALRELRAKLSCGTRRGFHVFRYQGDRLLYDLATGSLLAVSEPAMRVLAELESERPLEDFVAGLAPTELEAIGKALEEVVQLHEAGLLRVEPDATPVDRERTIRGLENHHPRKMMLMVQTNCNLACSYCYEVQNGFHATGKRMDLETGKRSVEFLIQRSGPRQDIDITFFGGEPLMNFELVRQLVEYCDARGAELGKRFGYQLTTNCTLLNDEMIAFLVKHEFGLMLSIDGPPELHDIHRKHLGGAGSGAVALENARRLVAAQRKAGVREAMIRATMTHENHDARALTAFFTAQGFSRIMLGASDGRGGERESWDIQVDDVALLHEQHEASVEEYLAWIDGRGPRPDDHKQIDRNLGPILDALRQPDPTPRIGCGVARNMQAITRDGKIYPCHRYVGDEPFQLGTLEEGLDPAKVRAYYDALMRVKEEHCSHCWARITCGGQCPWHISTRSGEVLNPDTESCDAIRRGHERQLWLVHQLQKRGRLPESDSEEMRGEIERETEGDPS